MQFIMTHSDLMTISHLVLIATILITINQLIVKPLILNKFKGTK